MPVMNSPRAIERSVDKFYTTALLQEAGLPTPETVVCESAAPMRWPRSRAMGDVDHQADLRLDGARDGARQRSRRRVPRRASRSSSCGSSSTCSAPSITAAATFASSSSADACSARSSGTRPTGDWRTNVSRGGSARPFDLPPAWERAGAARDGGRRRRLRRRRSAPFARRPGVCPRGQRHSGMAGAPAGDRHRRRRRDRRTPRRARSRGEARADGIAGAELPT